MNMELTQAQKNVISAKLSIDLATITDTRIIELCLLYRSEPDIYPQFADNLKIEIPRRFTTAEIESNDVKFSVIQCYYKFNSVIIQHIYLLKKQLINIFRYSLVKLY